ncbi:MAG: polymerase sigma factor FliA [Clostridia bacterium]|jgi:RNA polymerase sigma factor for flagellar operon FliA|nr:polymerase sigma factor FliA [Clostridia bacterium]MDN5322956.1 polymerase sigma factor FliA [Clostridia bacterium]
MDGKKDLWQKFLNNPSIENRDQLILSYAPLIKYCAQKIYQGLPKYVDFDDLLSYGSFGLIDAINKFNPNFKNDFEAYATLRIRGAIIDGLRKMDWAPQSLRRKAKEIEKAYISLEQKLGRTARESEVADFLGITEQELEKQLQDVGYLSIISLEQPIDSEENDLLTIGDLVIDTNCPDPTMLLEKNEIKSALSKAITQLSENEKLVITLFYFEELTVKEIGKILELSEGRISQIHKKAVIKLKSKLYNLLN